MGGDAEISAPSDDFSVFLQQKSFHDLFAVAAAKGRIGADTFELFTAIQTQNPFAADVVTAFVDQARSLLLKELALSKKKTEAEMAEEIKRIFSA